jgi:hypothetical protein
MIRGTRESLPSRMTLAQRYCIKQYILLSHTAASIQYYSNTRTQRLSNFPAYSQLQKLSLENKELLHLHKQQLLNTPLT